jgi:DNA-binding CsgD family transcriptional regulator
MGDTSSTIIDQVLRSLGVDGICVRVYLAMQESPQAGTAVIATQLGLEPAEVTDALDALSALSLLRPGVDAASGLRPVSHERAIQTLLRRHSEQLSLQRESLEMLQTTMKELLASPRSLQDASKRLDIEVVSGSEEVQSMLDEATLRASKSLASISSTAPAPREVLDAARSLDQDLVSRGVQVRVVYHDSALADSRNLQYAQWFASIGAQLRRAPVLPTRYILVDQDTALIPTTRVRPASQVLLVREPALVAPLIDLFEATWAAAEPLTGERRSSPNDGALTPQELALLRILAAGSTDDAAAKKLGVSVRTVRRIMADLMERLGATSRFEAGHQATQRGWL